MRKKLLTVLAVAILVSVNSFISTAMAGDAETELKALVAKVNADIKAGKRTEAELNDDLKQFDALLAEHKGEKTDAVARILYMKAMLYAEVLNNPKKADQLMQQLKSDFKGTALVTQVEQREQMQQQAEKARASLGVGATFPDFADKDVSGQPLSLASYRGKVVLIDFWATWCGPCRGEIPNVVATYQKYHSQGFEIIGISLDEDRDKLLSYTKQMNMTWPQFFDGQGWSNKLAVKYGVESIPATFLLNGDGKIIGTDLRGEELTQAVAKALAKK
ncbi:MAG TPA: TlpA disulfide reductase family protein [Candidatus Acidoferrum sp.]|nr:TlpA disulfide reductase family protein [Candidatus Acidoferrum sp.]